LHLREPVNKFPDFVRYIVQRLKTLSPSMGKVKIALAGTYHAFNFRKYAYRYLAEYQYRFNRRFDLKAILPRLVRTAATTGPRTETRLRLAEHSC